MAFIARLDLRGKIARQELVGFGQGVGVGCL